MAKKAVTVAVDIGNERNETVARTVLANMYDRCAYEHARDGDFDTAMKCLDSERVQLELASTVSPRDEQLLEQKASMLSTLANLHFRRGDNA